MASIFPFPPSRTTFHSKAVFHPKCHLHLSQCHTTSENSTSRTAPVPHLHLPPSPPHASLWLRCQPLSICISQKAPPAPGERRACPPWMGLTAGACIPVRVRLYGSYAIRAQALLPCHNLPTVIHTEDAHSDSGHLPSSCLAVGDTQRDRAVHRSALASLTGSPSFY